MPVLAHVLMEHDEIYLTAHNSSGVENYTCQETRDNKYSGYRSDEHDSLQSTYFVNEL